MGSVGGGVHGSKIHSNVVVIVGGGMDGVRVTKIGRRTDAGVGRAKRTLEVGAARALAVCGVWAGEGVFGGRDRR